MTDQPNDLAAEQATLGGCLISRDVASEVSEILRPDDFFTPRHFLIYESVLRLLLSGSPTDAIAVVDDLIQRGQLMQAGGADYVHHLTSCVPVAAQAPYHASLVSGHAVRRRVLSVAATIESSVQTMPVNDLIETARSGLDNAAGLQRQALTYVGDLIEEVMADAERPRRVYPTPWQGLTDILGGGFRPGALYVLAARPGIGKTAIALQIASALADAGPVAFSSMEMPKAEIVRRIISQGAEMPHHLLERGQPMPELWKARVESWMEIAPHSIALNDRATATAADVRSFARAVYRPSGRIAGVVTDYLQLMQGAPGMSRQEIVAENARQHKILAMELDCPVILLSQLNRNPEARMDKRPLLSDLRESGAIEQDADVVMMLYRDPDFMPAGPHEVPVPIPLELNVAKNRHGPTYVHTLSWEGSQMRAF